MKQTSARKAMRGGLRADLGVVGLAIIFWLMSALIAIGILETNKRLSDPGFVQIEKVLCQQASDHQRARCMVDVLTHKPEALGDMASFRIPEVGSEAGDEK